MLKRMRLIASFLVPVAAIVGTASAQSAAAMDSAVIYENCAAQDSGLPLQNCATVLIDRSLRGVMIRDSGHADLPLGELSDTFVVLNSSDIPIAVPKKDYRGQKTWTYGDHVYRKIVSQRKYFLDEAPLDVIAVMRKSDVGSERADDKKLLRKAVLTFWFSPQAGVKALAFPDHEQFNGDAFFCASSVCAMAGVVAAD